MCGIYGFSGGVDPGVIKQMATTQVHRGPDDSGFRHFREGDTTIGMSRLSIIDLAGGHQPMAGASGRTWIVFNGEIFNARELRAEWLEGVDFQSDHSDTEVLVNLYEKLGSKVVDRLNGMFGFVIYDAEKNVLFGARDPLGIKPLFYYQSADRFAFSSELKSFRVLPGIDFELDVNAIGHYLGCQTILAPRTVYRSIRKLRPGECFTYDLKSRRLDVRRYWRPDYPDRPITDRNEARELVRSEFQAAVERWSRSDVPIACSLSGGIDSSAVVGALADGGRSGLKTFSLGFNDAPDIDERKLAASVVERWQTDHRELVITDTDLLDELPAMMHALDEPYAGGLPSWWVFKGMSEEVKVGMTGSGGDELFSNYGKYLHLESFFNRCRRSLSYLRRGGRLMTLLRYGFGALHYPFFPAGARGSLLTREVCGRITESAEELLNEIASDCRLATARNQITSVDLRVQLPEEFLFMTDRFSMAHSLEARTPFLDRQFVEQMLLIDPKVRVDSGKTLFKEAVEDLLPEQVLEGPKKGFVIPESQWLRGQLRDQVEELFAENHLKDQGIWDPTIRRRLVEPHLDESVDYGWQLWTIFMFQLWHHQCHQFRS